jgi:hypothetical protein
VGRRCFCKASARPDGLPEEIRLVDRDPGAACPKGWLSPPDVSARLDRIRGGVDEIQRNRVESAANLDAFRGPLK